MQWIFNLIPFILGVIYTKYSNKTLNKNRVWHHALLLTIIFYILMIEGLFNIGYVLIYFIAIMPPDALVDFSFTVGTISLLTFIVFFIFWREVDWD